MPQSPEISDDEGEDAPTGRRAHSGFPGATGLKYTQTIMGPSRVGTLGMRVAGKRAMTTKDAASRSSVISVGDATPKRTRADSEPTPAAPVTTSPTVLQTPATPEIPGSSLIQVGKRRSAGGSSLSEIATTLVEGTDLESPAESQSSANAPMVLQSMTRIAAVQARRPRRRAHFSSAGNNAARPIIVSETSLNPEDSSDEETGVMSGSLPEDDFIEHLAEGDEGIDVDADEFDPYVFIFLIHHFSARFINEISQRFRTSSIRRSI